MKIKQLHIRNIASLEKGDIDFENGLRENGSEQATPLFLICGDTGAGKTTILDCISMCLYGTTPRVESVANKKTNTFTTSDGEALNIFALEQYTRHGISPKDECYCELEFEGNDGHQYISRLELGMKGTRNKGGVFHHRDAQLILIRDGVELTRKKQEATAFIQKAVGLSFEQFSRISMLAQGQFQNFLVGEKKERETILEQLTDTERYSHFGKAITRLAKKYKGEYDVLATLCKEQAKDILPEEKRAEKEEQKAILANDYIKLCKERDTHLERLNRLKEIHNATARAEEDRKELSKLLEAEKNPPYSTAGGFISRWHATVEQRQWLIEKRNSESNLRRGEKEIAICGRRFMELSADLSWRNELLAKEKEQLSSIESAIEQHSRLEMLYPRAGEAGELIRQYNSEKAIIATLTEELANESSKTASLRKGCEESAKETEEARLNVKKIQESIDTLSARLDDMNPKEITARLEKISETTRILSDLNKAVISADEKKAVIAGKEEEAEELRKSLVTLKEECGKAELLKKETAAAMESTRSRLENMSASTGKYLKELRARLADEKADTCPLCGQKIEHLILDEELEAILLPLRKEKEEAQKIFDSAESEFRTCNEKVSHTEGSLSSLLATISQEKESEENLRRGIIEKAVEEGFDTEQPLLPQLEKRQEEIAKTTDKLKKQLDDSQSLQKEINVLIKNKRPLDVKLAEKEKKEKNDEKSLEANLSSIKNKEEQKEQHIASLKDIDEKCNALLSPYYPDWRESTDKIRKEIIEKAAEYDSLCKERDIIKRKAHDISTLIHNISRLHDSMSGKYASTETPMERKEAKCKDILSEWNSLSAADASATRKTEEAAFELKEKDKLLADYYIQSGDTEEELSKIIDSPLDIKECTELCQKLRMDIASLEHSVKENEEKHTAYEKENGLEPGTPLPEITPLREEYETAQKETEANRTAYGILEGELKKDEEARLRLKTRIEETEAARQVAEKWERVDSRFGGTRLRTLVQTHILKPLLDNANIYLSKITDQYTLTCSDKNENLSILVLDRYNKNQVRSATVLSGGERFMISLALSLALSSLNRGSLNVDILFIDEGFGTLDEKSLDSVMSTLERLQDMAGQSRRRVGIISHREELEERIPVQIRVKKRGDGRSHIQISN